MTKLTSPRFSATQHERAGRRIQRKLRQFKFFENRIVETGSKATERFFEFLTVPEFASLIRKGETTVRRYIREGRLKALNPGGHWLIPVTEAELFLRRVNARKLNHAEKKVT